MEDPAHAEDCAKVCEFLRSMKVKAELQKEPRRPMDFQRLMVTSCQREFEQNLKARNIRNIRLIGELYNRRMLTDRIMHEIIRKLLGASDEEDLECLYWLLITSGKNLEEATNIKFASQSNSDPSLRQNIQGLYHFDEYFAKIDEIVKTKEISHVKYLLQHVIYLRKINWEPLAQIHEIQNDCETSMVKMLEKQRI